MMNESTFTVRRSSARRPASMFGLILLVSAVAGCSSESKQLSELPAEAVPAASGSPSAPGNPFVPIDEPSAGRSGPAVNPFSDSAAASPGSVGRPAIGTPSFTRPTSSAPYGYAAGGSTVRYGSGVVRYGSAGPSFTQRGVHSGSAAPYYGSRPSFGSGVAYRGSSGPYNGARQTYGSAVGATSGGVPPNPVDTRLAELERRAAELEQRVQALIPAVQQAVQGRK